MKIKHAFVFILTLSIGTGSYLYLSDYLVEEGWIYGEVLNITRDDKNIAFLLKVRVSKIEYYFKGTKSEEFNLLSNKIGQPITVYYHKKLFDKLPDHHFIMDSWK